MICFAYPHPYASPPEGDYFTLAEEFGSGWSNVHRIGDIQDPKGTYDEFRKECPVPSFVVPMTEEAVLSSAFINQQLRLPGLGLTSALDCACRSRQRARLHKINPDLNPKWVRADRIWTAPEWEKCVVKAGSSTLGHGVRIVKHTDINKVKLHITKAEQTAYYEIARTERVAGSNFRSSK